MTDDVISKILNALETHGYLTERQFYNFSEQWGTKFSTCQRRLREMTGFLENGERHENYDSHVKVERTDDGVIKGYVWDSKAPRQEKLFMSKKDEVRMNTCCASYNFFQQHAKGCKNHPDTIKELSKQGVLI